MANRMTAALVAILLWASSAFSQPAPEIVRAPGSILTERTDLSAFLPSFDANISPDRRVWITGEYLFTWIQGGDVPPLASTSDPGTPRETAGVLGTPGSSALFDGSGESVRSGLRLGMGTWFNADRTLGVEAGAMVIESQSRILSANSSDGTILARPFRDANTLLPQAVLIAFPGLSNGTLDIRASSGNFYGMHLALNEKAYEANWFRLDSILGYRFYRYDEGIHVLQTISPIDPAFIPGTQLVSNDLFNTRNEFHGLDMGFRSHFTWDNLSVEVLTKVAIGRLHRTSQIEGDQTISVPGAEPVKSAAGVLALTTNSRTFRYDDWAAVPEAGVAVNWQVRPNLGLRVGYSFLLLQSVVRAGDQIDATLNPNFFPGGNQTGPIRPAFNLTRSEMWIQSASFGLLFTY